MILNKVKAITGIAACLLMFPAISGFSANAQNRPTISPGVRAMDTIEVQNVMSEHEYYHAAGENVRELKALWVSANGPNAKTAAFFAPGWCMQGIATIMKNYGIAHENAKEEAFQALKKAYPKELANMTSAKTSMIGGEFAMHLSTTPVIQIAGDGKTAKGIWYSAGMGLMPHMSGKNVGVGAIFFWEKYAADFIKENGQWKIWHLGMFYDFTPSFPASMTARLGKGNASAQGGPGGPGGPPKGGKAGAPPKGGPPQASNKEQGERLTPAQIAKGGMLPNPYRYPNWSPIRKSFIMPPIPQPYYTFSQTFSYSPYDKSAPYKNYPYYEGK